ncbi:hypothetical protein HYQ46_012728 [Verticillium longisporum]|nr:hypothetical protein HYQ46_012728 [Verticillium longisporum]
MAKGALTSLAARTLEDILAEVFFFFSSSLLQRYKTGMQSRNAEEQVCYLNVQFVATRCYDVDRIVCNVG